MGTSAPYVEQLWARQRAWSKAANRAKRRVERYRRASLILVVLAAGLGTGAPFIASMNSWAGRTAGGVAGFALATLPLVRRRLGVPTYETWIRLRTVSESIKQEVYIYLARVAPYRGDDRPELLYRRTEAFFRTSGDLVRLLREADAVQRPLPQISDVQSYRVGRVQDQITTYYEPQARLMRKRAGIVKGILFGLAGLAAVFGVLAAGGATALGPWTGVVGTVSGALIAHSAAARYGFLELEYAQTADQLKRLQAGYRVSTLPPDERDDWFVSECERVISYQNQEWMTELVTARHDTSDSTIAVPHQV